MNMVMSTRSGVMLTKCTDEEILTSLVKNTCQSYKQTIFLVYFCLKVSHNEAYPSNSYAHTHSMTGRASGR